MKIPISWLKEYVDMVVPLEELAHRLTMAGTEVGQMVSTGNWKNCFVGLVIEVEPHPNADRLTLCTVALGAEQMRVVCGAPNVAEGQKIAFAKVGAELINTHTDKLEPLKAARIRGVVSEGMVCSERELGMGDDHTSIVILPEDAPPGTPLSDYLGDHIFDLEVTPNRPDCLSLLGVAREVAALTGVSVREPDPSYPEEGDPIDSMASVEIVDPELCPRYTASLISGVTIGPSPTWLQDRLIKAGMRPINNVVDVTNYVMLEYNQPMHAFDFRTLKEAKIVVRRARTGERLISLDGLERTLSPSMLVIADAVDAVALGGVIGAADSEVTESTTDILLESACFSPVNNRRTAQALGISTEASDRFEKGLRPELPPIALRRATQLIREIAGGVVAKGIVDEFPGKQGAAAPEIVLTMARFQKVLGTTKPVEQLEEVLKSLGFDCERINGSDLKVTAPYWRSDISIEDDLIEEVARIAGYDKIPTTMLSTPIPGLEPQPKRELRERLKDLLVGCGLQEVISYPASSLQDLTKVRTMENSGAPIKLANPMSGQHEYMRTTLRDSLLSTMASNRSHQQGPIAIFETGRVYLPREGDLPEEREMVGGILSGSRQEAHWLSDDGHLGFYDAKGVVETLLTDLGLAADYQPTHEPVLHPGKSARVVVGERLVGVVGEIHPVVAESFGLERDPTALFELDIETLLEAIPMQGPRYSPIGRFPSAMRDLSIVVDMDVPAAKVHAMIASRPIVGMVQLFDSYSGGNLPTGKHSLAYHVYFQSADRTLTAEEVNASLDAVILSLKREVRAVLRGQTNEE